MTAPSLTDRQGAVLRLVDRGLSNEEIAAELGISARVVKTHCDNLRRKLGVERKVQLPAAARAVGLLA